MKIYMWTILALLIAQTGLAAVEASMTIKIVDDNGIALEDVKSMIVINSEDGKKTTNMVTDTNGYFSINVKIPARISLDGQKNGYYRSRDTIYLIDNAPEVELHDECTLIMKRIIDPKAGKKWGYRGKAPRLDKELGFDLLVGDWVAPYGKGMIKDFIFTCSNDATNQVASYILSFSNPEDGIIEYPRDKEEQSFFRWPHLAPLTGYSKTLKEKVYYGSKRDQNFLPDHKLIPQILSDIGYIFRVRTECDKDGNLISAYYGRIDSAIITGWDDVVGFGYWLNTDPHSRSLESTDSTSP